MNVVIPFRQWYMVNVEHDFPLFFLEQPRVFCESEFTEEGVKMMDG